MLNPVDESKLEPPMKKLKLNESNEDDLKKTVIKQNKEKKKRKPLDLDSKEVKISVHNSGKPFDDSIIPEHIMASLEQVYCFKFMTLVQDKCIKRIHEDDENDFMVRAKTGSGKTIGFLVPAIARMIQHQETLEKLHQLKAQMRTEASDSDSDSEDDELEEVDTVTINGQQKKITQFVRILIITPTRELAQQIEHEANLLLTFQQQYKVKSVIGGRKGRNAEQSHFKMGLLPDIMIATPGRLLDHLRHTPQFKYHFSKLQTFILDEADELLSEGHRDTLLQIRQFLPSRLKRQTLLFSATASDDIKDLAVYIMKPKYAFINCVSKHESDLNENLLTQYFLTTTVKDQYTELLRVLIDHVKQTDNFRIIVFFNTARQAQYYCLLTKLLAKEAKNGLPFNEDQLYEMHSKMKQTARSRISHQFKKEGNRILFSSDVNARGIDYPNVSLIVQFGIAASIEHYIHRIGRTARAGKTGEGILILNNDEQFFLMSLKARNQNYKLIPYPKGDSGHQFRFIISKCQSQILTSEKIIEAHLPNQVYVSYLGFMRQFLKKSPLTPPSLSRLASEYVLHNVGLSRPFMPRELVSKLQLANLPNLNIK